jgi:hypothetical protein
MNPAPPGALDAKTGLDELVQKPKLHFFERQSKKAP